MLFKQLNLNSFLNLDISDKVLFSKTISHLCCFNLKCPLCLLVYDSLLIKMTKKIPETDQK